MRRIKFLPFILLFFCTGFLQAADAVYVSEIKFEGSDTFSNKILKKNIRLKSKGIFRQTEFNPKTLKLDVISLQRFYLSKGFVDVEITTGVEDVDDRFVDVSFYITEGKRYKIKSLDVFGNHLLSDQTVQGIIKLKSGDYYNPARIIENLDKLEYEYFSKGKLLVSIAESVDIQRDGVDVKIDISEGRTYHVGEINISGLETKPEKYVRRELKFASGDLYDISKIEKSQNRIFSSGLFSSVEIHPSFPADNDEIVNMEIKVREYTSRSYQFDLGIGQEQSVYGSSNPPATIVGVQAKWKPGTVLNTANRIEFGGQIGLRVDQNVSFPPRDFYVSWFSPWLYKARIPLRLKYYFEEIKNETLELSRQGFEMSLLYRRGETYNFVGGLSFEDISAKDETSIENFELDRKIEFRFFRQKLNSFITPTSGYFYSIGMSLNGSVLGGKKHYLKLDTEVKRFYPLAVSSTVGIRFKLGYIEIFPQTDIENDMDFYDFFWLGGDTSLRGWDSPGAYAEERDESTGAVVRLQYNAEYRFPVIWRFGGEVFFDSGKLLGEWSGNVLDNWDWDVGAGVTFMTPIGPVRLDFAYPNGEPVKPTILISLLYMF